MKRRRYIREFLRLCPSVKIDLGDRLTAMGLWIELSLEFVRTLGRAHRKTKEILEFARRSASPKAHPAMREAVDYAFGEHLLDHPDKFPSLAKHLTLEDLELFSERLAYWNGKSKYLRLRKQLQGMIEGIRATAKQLP